MGPREQAVWPDGRIKSIPISPKVFTLKVMLFKTPKQISKYLGYFRNNFFAKNFQKSPNLFALLGRVSKHYSMAKANQSRCTINIFLFFWRIGPSYCNYFAPFCRSVLTLVSTNFPNMQSVPKLTDMFSTIIFHCSIYFFYLSSECFC